MGRRSPQLKFISVTFSSAYMAFLAITAIPSSPAIEYLIILIVNTCRIFHYLGTTSRLNKESQETK